jgi:hypothetical protein
MSASLKATLLGALVLVGGLLLSNVALAWHPCCPPPPPQTVVLVVCHPCTGCTYEVPVCIPACCHGAPTVCFQSTRIGYGRNVYQWNNGYTVVIRFPPRGGYRVVQGRV